MKNYSQIVCFFHQNLTKNYLLHHVFSVKVYIFKIRQNIVSVCWRKVILYMQIRHSLTQTNVNLKDISTLFSNLFAGTTWMQEIIWLIMHDGDFKGASQTPVYFRSPFLEFKDEILNEVGLDLANPMPSPRVIKTHLPYSMVPRQLQQHRCKVGK